MVPRAPPATHTWLMLMSRLPWWLGVLGAILAYVGLHGLALRGFASGQAPGTDPGHLVRALAGLGQWVIPAALLAGAAVSVYRQRHASRLHREWAADPVGMSLRDLGPGGFEALVGEVFRQHGYRVNKRATGCSGGRGEMLLTRADERATLPLRRPASRGTSPPLGVVHIRYWQAWRVGATEVQELIAAMTTSGAGRGVLVIPGEFTRDARRMATGRSVELIDGAGLRALVQADRAVPPRPRSPFGGLPLEGLTRTGGSAAAGPRRRPGVPIRHVLRLVGTLLAAAAILGGFAWITSLPDKRLVSPGPPEALAAPARQAPPSLVSEPAGPAAPAEPPPAPTPPPGLGGFRSVHELDAAFETFYMPPPGCANPASHAEMVACVNHRIRARKGYMAAGKPADQEPLPEAQQDLEGIPAWDDEAAINALAPSQSDQPDPDAAQWDPDDTPAPAGEAPPLPRKPEEKDPAATYAPYDPKAPWVGP